MYQPSQITRVLHVQCIQMYSRNVIKETLKALVNSESAILYYTQIYMYMHKTGTDYTYM